ncbi:hypothetical protein [Mesorhizobium sp. LjNodule214]|uniref:hypothetical protein n=1 Tax=Mesorhizobium sp. LjNodule214 TaxID=3342252 RepID=UPI003ECE4A9C
MQNAIVDGEIIVLNDDGRIQVSQALPGDAKAIFHLVDQAGLEGMVSKQQGQQISQRSVDQLAKGQMLLDR